MPRNKPSAASALTAADWAAKFAAIKVRPDGVTPCYGEITRVAALKPRVAYETLRRRYAAGQPAILKPGSQPALGPLEADLKEWLLASQSRNAGFCAMTVRLKARELAEAAGIQWAFKATSQWLLGFMRRNCLALKSGQFVCTEE